MEDSNHDANVCTLGMFQKETWWILLSFTAALPRKMEKNIGTKLLREMQKWSLTRKYPKWWMTWKNWRSRWKTCKWPSVMIPFPPFGQKEENSNSRTQSDPKEGQQHTIKQRVLIISTALLKPPQTDWNEKSVCLEYPSATVWRYNYQYCY